MAGERIMNDATTEWGPLLTASADSCVSFGDDRVLLTLSGPSCRILVDQNNDESEALTLAETDLFITSVQRVSVTFSGERSYRLVDSNRLCRMLAFVDAALPISTPPGQSCGGLGVQEVPGDIAQDVSRIEHWLALEVMRGNHDNALLNYLRRQEAYRLTGYLLNTPSECAHLNELCVRYGLSYSHFRRLCHRALGSSVKPRLREWRAARAVLDLVIGELPVLEVALDNGYASASHISSDIKQLFGITPRMAKNARSLLP
ncbi:hypothetical protein MyNCGM683_15480 [Achromobacter xylosoxidans]